MIAWQEKKIFSPLRLLDSRFLECRVLPTSSSSMMKETSLASLEQDISNGEIAAWISRLSNAMAKSKQELSHALKGTKSIVEKLILINANMPA